MIDILPLNSKITAEVLGMSVSGIFKGRSVTGDWLMQIPEMNTTVTVSKNSIKSYKIEPLAQQIVNNRKL